MTILLDQLISALPQDIVFDIPANLDIPIEGIVMDSRLVKPGYLFVALPGTSVDGHRFIPSAIQNGAAAIIGSEVQGKLSLPYIHVSDSRKAMAYVSAAFYGFPARQLTVIGVTGTDGKTTTVNLIYSILKAAGINTGVISTVNAIIGDQIMDTGFHVTTPEAPEVQYYLAQMAFQKPNPVSHVILEATSHGLAQHRVTACEFDLAVFTNITHEHLDYHKTFEAYRDAKSMLIKHLADTIVKIKGNYRKVVLNQDDASFDYLKTLADSCLPANHVISYGLSQNADFYPQSIISNKEGMQFQVNTPFGSFKIETALIGSHNVSNILAALAASVGGLGIDISAAIEGIARMKGVEGRMERIDYGQNFTAIVDFAHTPNALKVALETVRQVTSGRVIAVFGSAGLRDREKRRLMAENAAQLADISIMTAEDPRTESLDAILAEMAKGMDNQGGIEGKTYWRIPDRREALRFAVNIAAANDLVIAFGKGHEQSMCFGDVEYAWDDRTALRAAITERLGIPGPAMPFLPT